MLVDRWSTKKLSPGQQEHGSAPWRSFSVGAAAAAAAAGAADVGYNG